ncbi:MAG: hypothetical protein OXI77_08725 [Chloroflexota bacterium]|nr:hypothetical protein [Chloroflexota bacterium]MDE2909703.1 hypothetical protein [Chloroflexota bacterium]
MPRVLIVGKTKKWDEACVGGLVLDESLKSVRLLTASGEDQPADTPFEVGCIWEITFEEIQADNRTSPHSEDVRVIEATPSSPRIDQRKLVDFIRDRFCQSVYSPAELFDGLVKPTDNYKWFVASKTGLPSYSTGFWRLDNALRLFWVSQNRERKPRYIYLDDDGNNPTFDVPYVGFEEPPLVVIPRGAIVRFSLAQPFKNDKQHRCYLQLSGWFL